MVVVTFRETNEQLTDMFSHIFSSVKAAKAFIKEDAEHWAKAHSLKHYEIANVPETDHFEVRNAHGNPVITYQYFNM